MKKLTIDSSVIIASLLVKEPRHQEAVRIWESVLSGESIAIMPYSIFVEVVAAIKRRTGSEDLAREVKKELLSIENISFVVLDQDAAEKAAELAILTGVRGMDALVIQTAKEFETELVSFDDELVKKAQIIFS
jgi:predicted nucleic acid-binding protein